MTSTSSWPPGRLNLLGNGSLADMTQADSKWICQAQGGTLKRRKEWNTWRLLGNPSRCCLGNSCERCAHQLISSWKFGYKQDCETLDQRDAISVAVRLREQNAADSSSIVPRLNLWSLVALEEAEIHRYPWITNFRTMQIPELTKFLLFSWVLTQFPTDFGFTTLQVTTLILRCTLTHHSKESLAEHHTLNALICLQLWKNPKIYFCGFCGQKRYQGKTQGLRFTWAAILTHRAFR